MMTIYILLLPRHTEITSCDAGETPSLAVAASPYLYDLFHNNVPITLYECHR